MNQRISRHRAGLIAIAAMIGLAACSEPAPEPAPGTNAATDAAAAPAGPPIAQIDARRAANAGSESGNWLLHGRTYDEQRFSPLTKVTADNVDQLGLAWYWDTGTDRGLEASPIVVDGMMFTSGAWSMVFAHDARNGELLWQYDPEVPKEWGVNACCDVVNRGVAVWKGRVYVGTIDGRLVALDARTGEEIWDILTIDKSRPYTITGAPRIVKDQVVIGNGGAEYGVRGYITAYDADTGEQNWRFYTVPGDPSKPVEGDHLKEALATWRGGEWWKVGGGGTAWDSMSYDPELNLLYVGVGNGSPWNRYIRSPGGGDNLYLSSIVAINPDTGAKVWHYQTTPGDNWDYTATQHMILADLEIQGQLRKVIMQAPKNGFFYVLDRTNGEFISAEAYVPVNWASGIDPETGRPIETSDGDYSASPKLVFPAPYGGHNWHPMTFSPDTGLVYIPVLDIPFLYGQDNGFRYDPETWNTGIDFLQTVPPATVAEEKELRKSVKGHLAAWDPVQQKEVWRVQHAGSWNGGLLSTAGNLVFQGRADGYFAAYSADDGRLLWQAPTYTGIIAPPISYEIDGEQYIAVMAGWGGAFALASGVPPQKGNLSNQGRLLAFKLGAKKRLPELARRPPMPKPPALATSKEQLAMGEKLFHLNCSVCHGGGAVGSGGIPDLRDLLVEKHAAWDSIVLDGAFVAKGMVSFSHLLSKQESAAIQQYVISRAHKKWEFERDGDAPATGGD